MDGDRRAGKTGLAPFLPFLPPGGVLQLGVLREGAEMQVGISPPTVNRSSGLNFVLSMMAVSISFYAMGMLMGAMRPDDAVARLGCVAGLSVALRMFVYAMTIYLPVATGFERVLYRTLPLLEFFPLAVGYHFLLSIRGPAPRAGLAPVGAAAVSVFPLPKGFSPASERCITVVLHSP